MLILLMILGVVGTIFLTAFYSGTETALYMVSLVRTKTRAKAGDQLAKKLLILLDNLSAMVTTVLIGNNITIYIASFLLTTYLATNDFNNPEIIATAILTPLFFIFAESFPKQLACHIADIWAPSAVRTMTISRFLFSPIVWLMNKTAKILSKILTKNKAQAIALTERAKLLEYFEASAAENLISTEQNKMAKRIMELEKITVKDLMIPINRLLLMHSNIKMTEAVKEMSRKKADIVVLTNKKNVPIGKIISLSIMVKNSQNENTIIDSLGAELIHIHAGMTLSHALKRFKKQHVQKAFVINRKGEIIGLLTAASLLNIIVRV